MSMKRLVPIGWMKRPSCVLCRRPVKAARVIRSGSTTDAPSYASGKSRSSADEPKLLDMIRLGRYEQALPQLRDIPFSTLTQILAGQFQSGLLGLRGAAKLLQPGSLPPSREARQFRLEFIRQVQRRVVDTATATRYVTLCKFLYSRLMFINDLSLAECQCIQETDLITVEDLKRCKAATRDLVHASLILDHAHLTASVFKFEDSDGRSRVLRNLNIDKEEKISIGKSAILSAVFFGQFSALEQLLENQQSAEELREVIENSSETTHFELTSFLMRNSRQDLYMKLAATFPQMRAADCFETFSTSLETSESYLAAFKFILYISTSGKCSDSENETLTRIIFTRMKEDERWDMLKRDLPSLYKYLRTQSCVQVFHDVLVEYSLEEALQFFSECAKKGIVLELTSAVERCVKEDDMSHLKKISSAVWSLGIPSKAVVSALLVAMFKSKYQAGVQTLVCRKEEKPLDGPTRVRLLDHVMNARDPAMIKLFVTVSALDAKFFNQPDTSSSELAHRFTLILNNPRIYYSSDAMKFVRDSVYVLGDYPVIRGRGLLHLLHIASQLNISSIKLGVAIDRHFPLFAQLRDAVMREDAEGVLLVLDENPDVVSTRALLCATIQLFQGRHRPDLLLHHLATNRPLLQHASYHATLLHSWLGPADDGP